MHTQRGKKKTETSAHTYTETQTHMNTQKSLRDNLRLCFPGGENPRNNRF